MRTGIMLKDVTIDDKLRRRFWSKVNKSDGCWEWKASFGFRDYGKFKIKSTYIAAHRVSYYITNGVFNESLLVCHTCDNPKCVRPDHLFLGTISDNVRDKMNKGRHKFITPWGNPNWHSEHRWRNV